MEDTFVSLFDKELVVLALDVPTAEQAISTLAGKFLAHGYVKESFLAAVLKREGMHPTGLPTEVPVGMPHTDVEHCIKPGIAVGVLKRPVEFGAMGEIGAKVTVNLVFLLSVVNPAAQVKLLSQLIDFFQKSDYMRKLASAKSAEEVLGTLSAAMVPQVEATTPATPAEVATPAGFEAVVQHPAGLHARPAAKFVEKAATFPCKITIQNLENDKPAANAKSILAVLSLEIARGNRVRVQADGERAADALKELEALVQRDHD